VRTTTQARRGTSQGRSRPGEDYYTGQEREQARGGAGQVRITTQARKGNKPGEEQAR